ncbi:hypothetical protein WJX74_001984 [Apatococcus lobatus]|uniref:Probable magnesium transporter n=1 Tax=Apatococcus lobatus TaxID=904363 RepID=A0AAW1RY94_9CHLO
MAGSWILGATVNVVGSILINLGTNFMKLGHNKRAAMEAPDKDKPLVRHFKEWQFGCGLFSLGNIMNFISFGYAAQSLLAALGSIQFVSNVVFAHLVLHEKGNQRVYLATAGIMAGCVLLVSFGNHQSQTVTVTDLMSYYQRTPYIIYLLISAALSASAWATYEVGKVRLMHANPGAAPDGLIRLLPVSYAAFSGAIGTQAVLFAKMLSSLLRTSVKGDSQMGHPFAWATAILLVLSATFWVTRLNRALRLFPAMVIVPTMQISWTLFSILSGGVFFEEYLAFTQMSAAMFLLGVVVVLGGVYLLMPGTAKVYRELQEYLLRNNPSKSSVMDGLETLGRWQPVAMHRDEEIALQPMSSGASTAYESSSERGLSPRSRPRPPSSRDPRHPGILSLPGDPTWINPSGFQADDGML